MQRTARYGACAIATACPFWWKFPLPTRTGKVIQNFEYGYDIFDIDVSPDGQFLTGAISDVSGRQKLVRFSIADLRNFKA